MDKNPVLKIYELIRTAKVVRHKKRQEFLCDMIQGHRGAVSSAVGR